jgi:hypothetical protein
LRAIESVVVNILITKEVLAGCEGKVLDAVVVCLKRDVRKDDSEVAMVMKIEG